MQSTIPEREGGCLFGSFCLVELLGNHSETSADKQHFQSAASVISFLGTGSPPFFSKFRAIITVLMVLRWDGDGWTFDKQEFFIVLWWLPRAVKQD